MRDQTKFKRYELKYLLDEKQKEAVLFAMNPYMELDEYGRSIIRNIYFDTEDYRLIRRSIEGPVYKEKLRLRSYRQAGEKDYIYVELKKKYDSIVYKRRIKLQEDIAMDWLRNGKPIPLDSQISKEIDYFCRYYSKLQPRVYLSYEREAFYALDGSDFRVTFDENIRYREDRLSFCEPPDGKAILQEGKTLMEIKTSGGIPLWLTRCMTEQQIYKTSFSKYGNAYKQIIEGEKKISAAHKKATA
ncbi:MAG: polyphosphate polymerase domain-containing protein [Wujia sp.]